ncbi:MAG: rRNA pseudouridine synthase [Synergistaceae bacterium]|jgi:23S rRNA pseudouridine2605 synthase|nr:rRNA pseudouridine synthase [Synergistaceae bacterium]
MRLNAFLAGCGLTSRRKGEELILAGSVKVNGKIVLAPYFDVTPGTDAVECGGVSLTLAPKVYIAMNKPAGVVCAVTDKYDPVVVDLLPPEVREKRVFPVGRLDRDSEGLLLLTNDGAFAQSVQHPSKGVTKEYEALLNIEINARQLERWRAGFEIEGETGGKFVRPLEVEVMPKEPRARWIRVTVGEGLKREVRTMAQLSGFRVVSLIRRRIGRLVLKNLPAGQFVELSFSVLYTRITKGGSV